MKCALFEFNLMLSNVYNLAGLFEDDLEISKYSDCVFEKLSNLSKEKEFCGIWGRDII